MDHRMSRGVWSGARSSSATSHASLPLAWQVLLLLAAGVTVALLHEGFRFPLKMPGHHGIEWFGILLLARLASPLKLAGITVAAGAILGTATFGAHGSHYFGQAALNGRMNIFIARLELKTAVGQLIPHLIQTSDNCVGFSLC